MESSISLNRNHDRRHSDSNDFSLPASNVSATFESQPLDPFGFNLVDVTIPGTHNAETKKRRRETTGEDSSESSRAEQQRLASRKYRQKKKVLVEQLEAKMKEVADEKARIEEEHRSTLEVVEKLKKENNSLKVPGFTGEPGDSVAIEMLKQQKAELHIKLKAAYDKHPESNDEMELVLAQLKACLLKLIGHGQSEHCLALNPRIISHLMNSGFFEAPKTLVDTEDRRVSSAVRHFAAKIQELIPKLSEQQQTSMDNLLAEHDSVIKKLHEEREALNKSIGGFMENSANAAILSMGKTASEHSTQDVLLAMSSLELLRKNLKEEVEINQKTVLSLVETITPRQQALFFIEVDFQQKSVMQLKKIWESMKDLGPH